MDEFIAGFGSNAEEAKQFWDWVVLGLANLAHPAALAASAQMLEVALPALRRVLDRDAVPLNDKDRRLLDKLILMGLDDELIEAGAHRASTAAVRVGVGIFAQGDLQGLSAGLSVVALSGGTCARVVRSGALHGRQVPRPPGAPSASGSRGLRVAGECTDETAGRERSAGGGSTRAERVRLCSWLRLP